MLTRQYSSRSGDGGAGELAAMAGLVIVVILAITFYLVVTSANLVVRTLIRHPNNKPLWIALAAWAISLVATVVLAKVGPSPTAAHILSGITFGLGCVLVGTAKVVDIYYEETFRPESTKRLQIDDVIHPGSWWKPAYE